MLDCDQFLHFMVEEDEDLDRDSLEAREAHARSCDVRVNKYRATLEA